MNPREFPRIIVSLCRLSSALANKGLFNIMWQLFDRGANRILGT